MDQVPNDKSLQPNEQFQQRFDKAITEYMQQHRISMGAACITRGDEVLIHQGYGTGLDTVFRIASLTKPITRAAIKLLISEGRLSLETEAFSLLGLSPMPGEEVNSKLEQITVDQLLNHRAGWDTTLMGYDPMAEQGEISTF